MKCPTWNSFKSEKDATMDYARTTELCGSVDSDHGPLLPFLFHAQSQVEPG